MRFKLSNLISFTVVLACCNALLASALTKPVPVRDDFTSLSLESNLQALPLQLDDENKIILFVNDGILNIKYNKPKDLVNGDVIIYNLLGQEVTRKKLENSPINQITLPSQHTCYIVKIHYSGAVYTQKIVVAAN